MLRYTVTDIPDGVTMTKAWLYVKETPTTTDANAYKFLEITPGASEEGQIDTPGEISDTGADGTGVLSFVFDNVGIGSVPTNKVVWMGVKVALDSGLVYEIPRSVRPLRVIPAFIERTS